MQKTPLRNWNSKYNAAVAQVQQTAKKLETAMPGTAGAAIALQQHKENQLGQWDKQAQTYQVWSKTRKRV